MLYLNDGIQFTIRLFKITSLSMIHSMTAFARRDQETPWGILTCEMRSVNHRYLELGLRLPEDLRSLEPQIRETVGGRVARGKLDCGLYLQAREGVTEELVLNERLAVRLIELARRLDALAGSDAFLRPADLLRWPGVLTAGERDAGALTTAAVKLLTETLDELLAMRAREGGRLHALLQQRIAAMHEIVARIKPLLPQLVEDFRSRLKTRVAEVKEVDPARLEQEVVLFAQRVDVEEEVDRLASHLVEVQRILDQAKTQGPVGRRLDFLMQELHREANTLGAKSPDLRLTKASMDLKVLIEQMREQVQNIE